MTISSVVPVNNYTGNGSTTKFDFDFLIENSEELVVTKSDSSGNILTLRENVDYSIHEIGNSSGSYITYPIAGSSYSVLSSDELLTLSLELEIKQENQFPQAKNFEPPIVEKALDYIIRLIQILNRKQERSIKVKESPNLNTEELVNNIEQIKANLTTLENINNDLTNIDAVNSNKNNIDTVAGKISDVETVSEISANITSVADNETNINAVNSNKTNIDTVAGNISDIETVAGISSEISAAANNSTNISTVANNISDINNAYSNAQTAQAKAEEASLSASSAQSSKNLAKDWANKTDGIVADNEYSAKYYALQSRDHAGVSYQELKANLGYSRKDNIDDIRLFNDVNKLAQSSFDSAKFTTEGSPSVTSNGIASGFSSSNYLKSTVTIDCTKTFRITFNERRGIAAKFNGFQLSKSGADSTPLFFIQSANTTKITLGLYLNGTLTLNEWDFTHSNYTDINYIVSWDKTTYTLEIKNALTNENILTQEVSSSTALVNGSSSTGVIIYGYNWNNAIAVSTTDLKQTSAYNDGFPVFSGNKTGTKTIFEDNYTVVGSPTIVDGIASDFSTSNYIYKTLNIPAQSSNKIVVEGKVIYNSLPSNNQRIIFSITNADSSVKLLRWTQAYSSGNAYFTSQYQRSSNLDSGDFSIGSISVGENCFRAVIEGSNINIYTGSSFENMTLRKSASNFYNGGMSQITVGHDPKQSGWGGTEGSVPLDYLKITIDDELVYVPCLELPYTESSSGALIIDSAYEDKVQAIYNNYGSALYYTLDRINKRSALPYGDLYSLIIKRSDGDWQMVDESNISLNTSVAIGEYNVDLSSILPNDEHYYECIFRYFISRTDTNSSISYYNIFNNTTETKRWLRETIHGGSSSSDTVSLGGQFTAIINKGRTVKINISGKDLSEQTLELVTFRRLGANY